METRKPNWWQIYASVPLMVAGLVIDSRMTYAPTVHQVVEIGIVIVVFGWMAMWVQANKAGIENEELDHAWASPEPVGGDALAFDADLLFPAEDSSSEGHILAYGPSPEMARNN